MQLDLGHLEIHNSFEWHGGTKDVASAVHLDVLHAEVGGTKFEGAQIFDTRSPTLVYRAAQELFQDAPLWKFCNAFSSANHEHLLD